jgi:hypothetical protein
MGLTCKNVKPIRNFEFAKRCDRLKQESKKKRANKVEGKQQYHRAEIQTTCRGKYTPNWRQ